MTAGPEELGRLLADNRSWVSQFRPGDLPAPPARGLCVITCMDARIVPLDVFGLAAGDAHVLRNAGGRVSDDVLRSLVVSTHVYGVRSVAVVHHTECGMAKASQQKLVDRVRAATGTDASGMDFLTIGDAQRALLGDVNRIVTSRLLPPDTAVAGYIYDVHTGVLTPYP